MRAYDQCAGMRILKHEAVKAACRLHAPALDLYRRKAIAV